MELNTANTPSSPASISDLCATNRDEKQELNRITQGGPIARPIGHLALKGTAKNWVAGKLRIVIEVRNGNTIKGMASSETNVVYDHKSEYVAGDVIMITAPEGARHLIAQTDPNIAESLVYLPECVMAYTVPLGEKLAAFNPKAFRGSSHIIKVRAAEESEIYAYRNLALNPMDTRGSINYFPHAKANFVTQDRSCLEARNAIDGCTENNGHGNYPYQSWGGGKRDDLTFEVDFGRNVEIDKITLYLRADFAKDHDTYWESMNVIFSDDSTMPIKLARTSKPQTFSFTAKKTSWVRLVNLKQPSLPLGFAALSEIEVYGKETR